MDTEMSTNVDDLNNMQELSSNIQEELDNGKANNISDSEIFESQKNISNLENLKNLQLRQLEELKQLKEIQQKQSLESENESKKKIVLENRSNLYKSIYDGVKQPILIFCLYILLSYPKTQYYIGKVIPKFYSDNTTLLNVIVQALTLFNILVIFKVIFSFL